MDVVLLTQKDCVFCAQAHEILARLATEYPLTVSTLDLNSAEGQALARRGGMLFPPGIVLDGDAFSYGRASERKLRREIERRLRETHRG